jgi:hypothetical protein
MPPRTSPPPLYSLHASLPPHVRELFKKLEVFNANMEATMLEIKRNSQMCRMHIKGSGAKGAGVWARAGVPQAGMDLFLYWGVLHDAATFDGSLLYSYSTDIAGEGTAVNLCGKAHLEELDGYWKPVNGAHINHGCRRANMTSRWVMEPATSLWYIVISSTKAILPGCEVLGNYNEGNSKFKFWRHCTTFAKDMGLFPKRFVKCSCNSKKKGKGCPNNFAYDRVEMQEITLADCESALRAAEVRQPAEARQSALP